MNELFIIGFEKTAVSRLGKKTLEVMRSRYRSFPGGTSTAVRKGSKGDYFKSPKKVQKEAPWMMESYKELLKGLKESVK